MSRNFILLFGVRLISFLGCAYFLHREYLIVELESNTLPEKYEVIKKSCRLRRGSHVIINSKYGEYTIEYYRKKCHSLEIGDSIELFYSKEYDFFHVPNSNVNRRYIYGLICFFLMTFILPPVARIFSRCSGSS